MPYYSNGDSGRRRDRYPECVGPTTVPQEIFTTENVQKLLDNKFVVVVGDSVQRGIYKDLVVVLQSERRLGHWELQKKGEECHAGDHLIERSKLTNGKDYREVRQYKSRDGRHLVRFYFVTRCYSTFMETVMADLWQKPQPDVVIMNSCLWDISRYGSSSMDSFKVNLQKVLQRFKQILSPDCLFIWNTTLPIGRQIRGGFLLPNVAFMADILRRDVLEANFYCQLVVADYEFDVLDLHYYFRNQIRHRNADGIHWDEIVHRRITNLILSHICEAWGLGLPVKRVMSSKQVRRRREGTPDRVRNDEQSRRGSHSVCDKGHSRHSYQPLHRGRSATCDPGYLGRVVERVAPSRQPLQEASDTQDVVELMQQDMVNQKRAMQKLIGQALEKMAHGQGEDQGLSVEGRNVSVVKRQRGDYEQRDTVGAMRRPRSYHRHHRVKPSSS